MLFKCKMCGSNLDVLPGITVCECDACGTRQTVPNADNEMKIKLFTRANKLRFDCDFDKAYTNYESIVTEFPDEAEAYWGLCLCKYGIEYVDDPGTGKKKPTCHRLSRESILEDINLGKALEYASPEASAVYREEAKQIEQIRRSIISISNNEEPYDIFICYKETDFSGNRTEDSVLAEDVYDQLTAEGYRVFFSRITLEDKLGCEYEPYIFAALNTAKIMLAFGTDYEYFHAVWVKNEWSRYLRLMAEDREKLLIPCYKGIDAYDMPKQFARLQAQDMGKLGWMQDLMRVINQRIPSPKQQTIQVQQTSNAGRELQALQIALQNEDWQMAEQIASGILEREPQNGDALFFRFLAKQHWKSLDGHKFDPLCSVSQNEDFLKAMQYSNPDLREKLLEFYNYWILEEMKHKASDAYQNKEYRNTIDTLKRLRENRYKNPTQQTTSVKQETISKDILVRRFKEEHPELAAPYLELLKYKKEFYSHQNTFTIIFSLLVPVIMLLHQWLGIFAVIIWCLGAALSIMGSEIDDIIVTVILAAIGFGAAELLLFLLPDTLVIVVMCLVGLIAPWLTIDYKKTETRVIRDKAEAGRIYENEVKPILKAYEEELLGRLTTVEEIQRIAAFLDSSELEP